jgi:hypothetical protein
LFLHDCAHRHEHVARGDVVVAAQVDLDGKVLIAARRWRTNDHACCACLHCQLG